MMSFEAFRAIREATPHFKDHAADGAVRVSTCFTWDAGWETLVFAGDSWRDVSGRRYDTQEEATQGHAEIVATWNAMSREDVARRLHDDWEDDEEF